MPIVVSVDVHAQLITPPDNTTMCILSRFVHWSAETVVEARLGAIGRQSVVGSHYTELRRRDATRRGGWCWRSIVVALRHRFQARVTGDRQARRLSRERIGEG